MWIAVEGARSHAALFDPTRKASHTHTMLQRKDLSTQRRYSSILEETNQLH